MYTYKTFKKGENLQDVGLDEEFLDSTTKAWSIKKSFCRQSYADERTSYRLEGNIFKLHMGQWTSI